MPPVKRTNILQLPVPISQKLATFLGLSGFSQCASTEPMISRAGCNHIIVEYIKQHCTIKINDGVKYVPDDKLSDVLNFKEFQRAVQQCKIVWKRRNRETGGQMDVVETDDSFSFPKLQYMLSFHFKGNSDKLVELNDKCVDLGLPEFDVYPYPLQVEEVENLWRYRPGGEKYQEAEKLVNGDTF